MILLIDNNDSFTFNVVQLIKKCCAIPVVVRNCNELEISEVEKFDYIIFSPGPGVPKDYPIMFEVLKKYGNSKPILGICLGHQAICEYFGGSLRNLREVIHGYESEVECNYNSVLFKGLNNLTVGRYHSWVVDKLPDCLRVTASCDNLIMAIEHKSLPIFGVQFHIESYITKRGEDILKNFLNVR